MTQVLSLTNLNDKNLSSEAELDSNSREQIVETLVEQGLPRVFNPTNYINRIAQNYGISMNDARACLKEAVIELEEASKEKEQPKNEEKLYAQSGYFYPSKTVNTAKEKDGMDSLAAYGQFQRLKFGL